MKAISRLSLMQSDVNVLGRASWKSQDGPQGQGQNKKQSVVLEVTEPKREVMRSVC